MNLEAKPRGKKNHSKGKDISSEVYFIFFFFFFIRDYILCKKPCVEPVYLEMLRIPGKNLIPHHWQDLVKWYLYSRVMVGDGGNVVGKEEENKELGLRIGN